jgi:ubiquinone/menaquinone biosynthesis C-methylase UbiE
MSLKDRFKKISSNYGELFSEVFAEQGMNYEELEKSIYDNVSEIEPNFRKLSILDIGVGDGVSSAAFINAGCKNLTGIDLNQEMVDATKVKYGDSIRLFKMNATDMTKFQKREFEIIISGATIHNIPRKDRGIFWNEILRLEPRIFVFAEKIKDSDITKHKTDYQKEIEAIKKIYGEKHNLKEAEKEWLDHYEYDEREALNLNEIMENIGKKYNVSTVFEMGLYKTILAIKNRQYF